MPIAPSTTSSQMYGWWSPQAYLFNGTCSIYQRPDGSYIGVTAVGHSQVCPYGATSVFQDAQFLGEVTIWVVNPPPRTPMAGSLVPNPPSWPAGSILPYGPRNYPHAQVKPVNMSGAGHGNGESVSIVTGKPSTSKKECDCPMNLLLRDGCRNPNHQ